MGPTPFSPGKELPDPKSFPTIRRFLCLCAAGKAKKLAIAACMRELLVILNAMLASGASW